MFTPLIAAVIGQPDLSAIGFTLNESRIEVGMLLNALISFIIVAAVVFFLIVMPVNRMTARARTEAPVEPTLKKCPEDVPRAAKRCGHCTSLLAA